MNDGKVNENGIEYIKVGDYYMPNLKAPKGVKISKLGKNMEDFELFNLDSTELYECISSAKKKLKKYEC